MSDKTVIVAHIHPFEPSKRIIRAIAPGQTVEEIVSGLGIKLGNPVVYVNGNRVIREAWAYRKAHEGDHVVVKVVPAGNGDNESTGNSKIGLGGLLWVVGMASFLIPGVGFIIGTALLIGGAGYAGLGIATKLGAFDFLKTGAGISLESALSIRGGSNQTPQLGTKIPVILGRHLVTPYYGARPYTEIGTVSTPGDTQYLRMLFCIGSGPLLVSQIKIGENLLASNTAGVRNGAITCDGLYSDVEVQVYEDGTNPSLYPNTVIEEQPSTELASGVEHWLTTSKNTDKIDADITFPSGLYKYSDDGTKSNHSVTVEVRRRAVGSGTAWASCTLVGTFAVTAAKAKTLRYTLNQIVTAGQYEVGMKRITADDSDGAKAQSIVQWSAFRSIRAAEPPIDASVRTRYVFIALKIKATSQLSGVISQLNLIAESVIPVWNGTTSGAAGWTTSAVSQNPAAIYLWALRGPLNPRPIADASIDWPRLETLHASCTTKAWTCNAVVTSESRLRDILAKIASTARSTPTIRDGLYSIVVDEAKTDIAQHFTPRNVRNFSWTKAFEDLPYGVLANFISADDGYDANQRIVPYDGYTEAEAEAKLEAIDLWGITDPELVYKHARYRLAVSKLRPEMMSFETDPEGIICETGDLVVLSHDAIVVGHASGRVKSVEVDGGGNAISVIVDELVTMATGESYGIRFRRTTGESVYTTVTTIAGETNEIIFAVAIASALKPAAGDLFTFGEAGIETARCIVAGVEGMEDLACRVYVVDEAPGVHTADSGTIPEFVSRVSPPASSTILDIVDAPPSVEDPVSDAIGDSLANSLISLAVSTVSIKRDRAGVLSPAALAMAGAYRTGTAYPGRFTIQLSHDGGVSYQAPVYTSSADESSHAYTVPATMVVGGTTYYVTGGRIRLHAAGGTTTRIGEALFTVAMDLSLAAKYLGIGILSSLTVGPYASATVAADGTITAGPAVATVVAGDMMVNHSASGGVAVLGLYKWSGTAWVRTTDLKDLTFAMNDLFGLSVAGIAIADATIVSLLIAKQILAENVDVTGQLTVQAGGRMRYETGAGVQKRCVQLADERIDWLDTPDTSPASPEQLQFRLGRLGVNGAVLADGELLANIEAGWSSGSQISTAASRFPHAVQMADGTERIAYGISATGYVERTRSIGGIWSAESTITAVAPPLESDYVYRQDGQLRFCYMKYVSGSQFTLHEKIWNGSSWGSELDIVTGAYVWSCAYIELPDGTLIIGYQRAADNYYCWKVYDDDTTTWGAEVVINSTAGHYPDLFIDSLTVIHLLYSTAALGPLVEKTSTDFGDNWSAATTINSADTRYGKILEDEKHLLNVAYQDYATLTLKRRVHDGSSWQAELDIGIAGSDPSYKILLDGTFRLNYVASTYVYEATLQRYARVGAGIIESGGDDLAFGGHYELSGNGKIEQWGWGFFKGDGTATSKEGTVTYPVPMVAVESFSNTCIGSKASSDPTSISDMTAVTGVYASGRSIGTSEFVARVQASGSLGSTARYGFSWHVIGRWR